jgi:spermidine synthase
MYYGEQEDDMCFYLDDWLHTCASFRPHYHEVTVHYPARFLDEVKRVLFIGGGDSMVLHEVLKYPELELVVGLELDQRVARSTFKNFGTQPHFDNEKVQWYFGDAANR